MGLSKIAGITIAALVTVAPSAFAQTNVKSDDKKATQTFTGCLMSDRDYQRAHHLGTGSTGEVVLVDVQVSPINGMAATTPSSGAAGASSPTPSTCADQGLAYRLRGSAVDKLKELVGHQVEIQGRYEHPDDVTAAGTPKPGELPPEVDIVSFREAPAAAVAPVTEPAAPPTPPQPPASTVQPAPTPAAPAPTALPHSASASGLLGLIGFVALSSGIVLTRVRRRAL